MPLGEQPGGRPPFLVWFFPFGSEQRMHPPRMRATPLRGGSCVFSQGRVAILPVLFGSSCRASCVAVMALVIGTFLFVRLGWAVGVNRGWGKSSFRVSAA